MGAFRREARTRTVGVLWQNVYCVLKHLHWRRAFWRVVEITVTYLDIACASDIPAVQKLSSSLMFTTRIFSKVMSIVSQHSSCDLLSTRTITAIDRDTDDDPEWFFSRRKFTKM
jgi:hypothetical protein